jgi:hypothetical protein
MRWEDAINRLMKQMGLSGDARPQQGPRRPHNIRLVPTDETSVAMHSMPWQKKGARKEGMARPQMPVEIKRRAYVDYSKYPGPALREIRKSATNFRGEIRR